jgi:hypothetical protein
MKNQTLVETLLIAMGFILCWSCSSLPADAQTEIPERLEGILADHTANDDAATNRIIDSLSDEREIDGADLDGEVERIWSNLRSNTNVEITVAQFAEHLLCKRPERSKRLLTKRLLELDREGKDDVDYWSPMLGIQVLRLFQALCAVHLNDLIERQEFIPETQLIIELKRERKSSFAGVQFTRAQSQTIIPGYIDQRDKRFEKFVSGKTDRGRDQIRITPGNFAALAKAIRDSDVE